MLPPWRPGWSMPWLAAAHCSAFRPSRPPACRPWWPISPTLWPSSRATWVPSSANASSCNPRQSAWPACCPPPAWGVWSEPCCCCTPVKGSFTAWCPGCYCWVPACFGPSHRCAAGSGSGCSAKVATPFLKIKRFCRSCWHRSTGAISAPASA